MVGAPYAALANTANKHHEYNKYEARQESRCNCSFPQEQRAVSLGIATFIRQVISRNLNPVSCPPLSLSPLQCDAESKPLIVQAPVLDLTDVLVLQTAHVQAPVRPSEFQC